MVKLNQINALVTANKAEGDAAKADVLKIFSREALFAGLEQTYRPMVEDDPEKLPPKKERVQFTVAQLLGMLRVKLTEVWDLFATQASGNQAAKADIKVGDIVIAKDVPASQILYLDKQLASFQEVLEKMPTPDLAEEWDFDNKVGMLKTRETQTLRTKKVEDWKVIVPPTEQHPAQAQKFTEDKPTGYWTKILYSGAVQATEKADMISRVKQLRNSLKTALEEANSIEVQRRPIADAIFNFVFQGRFSGNGKA